MDEKFRKAEEEYFILRGKLDTGRIGKNLFELALRDSMVQDAQNRWWMLGPDTGNWYMHDGTKWVEADPSHVQVAAEVTSAAPKSSPGDPSPAASDAPNRTLLFVGIGCAAIVCIGIVIAGIFLPGLFPRPSGSANAATLSALAALPTALTTPTPSGASFGTSTPAPTGTDTTTPTSTRFIAPRPSITPTPLFAPGVYVTGLRIDPPQPKRRFDITFFPSFQNSTDSPKSYKLKVYLFHPDEARSTGETYDNNLVTLPIGASEQSATGWRLGPGGCEDFFVRIGWVDDLKHVTLFTLPNGQTFQVPISVCP